MFEAATAKSDALKLAERKEKEALAAINNVAESIEAGRRNKTTATNPELLVAEEEVNAALYRLEQGRAKIGAVEGEARVVEQYRDIVEEGRQQFNKEMAAIMPDVKLGNMFYFDNHFLYRSYILTDIGKIFYVYERKIMFQAKATRD